jgi:hypothetical protein
VPRARNPRDLGTRPVAKRTTFEGAVAEEVRYWLGLTIEERISGVEAIRRASFRLYGGAPTRMARVSARVVAPWRPARVGGVPPGDLRR